MLYILPHLIFINYGPLRLFNCLIDQLHFTKKQYQVVLRLWVLFIMLSPFFEKQDLDLLTTIIKYQAEKLADLFTILYKTNLMYSDGAPLCFTKYSVRWI